MRVSLYGRSLRNEWLGLNSPATGGMPIHPPPPAHPQRGGESVPRLFPNEAVKNSIRCHPESVSRQTKDLGGCLFSIGYEQLQRRFASLRACDFLGVLQEGSFSPAVRAPALTPRPLSRERERGDHEVVGEGFAAGLKPRPSKNVTSSQHDRLSSFPQPQRGGEAIYDLFNVSSCTSF